MTMRGILPFTGCGAFVRSEKERIGNLKPGGEEGGKR